MSQVLSDSNDDSKEDYKNEQNVNDQCKGDCNRKGKKKNEDDEKEHKDKDKDNNGNDNENSNDESGSRPVARVMQTRKQAIEMWKKNKKVGQNCSDKRRWYCLCDVDKSSANDRAYRYWVKYDDEIQDILNERFSQFATNPNNLDLAAVEISSNINGVKEKYKVVFDRAYLFAEQVLAMQCSKNHLRRNVILAEPDERGFIHQIRVEDPFLPSPA